MLKTKLVYCVLPIQLMSLAELMKSNQYSENNGCGFILTTATPRKLIGKFIEKSITIDTIEDPFGILTKIESTTYYVCNFNWSTDSKILHVLNPPRSLRKFSNKMHELVGLGLVLSEINLDLRSFINFMQERVERIKVTEISSFGIRASDRASAKIQISGINDVRSDFEKLIEGRDYHLDKIVFDGEIENAIFTGEITQKGMLKIKSNNTLATMDFVRDLIHELNTSKNFNSQ